MQKFSDSALSQCPNCGGPVKKLISRSSFHLKGSGWYLTDYAQKNSPKETHHKSESSESTTEKPSSSPSTTSTTESD